MERALRVLDGGMKSAREVAAHLDGTTIDEAVQSGRSADVARIFKRAVSEGLVVKRYPHPHRYVSYELTAAGCRALRRGSLAR